MAKSDRKTIGILLGDGYAYWTFGQISNLRQQL
jgi:hypothetical protein